MVEFLYSFYLLINIVRLKIFMRIVGFLDCTRGDRKMDFKQDLNQENNY